jgi:fimbrial isopeptide formation D2 family protein
MKRFAAVAVVCAVLAASPAQAAALDSGDTGGPATRISSGATGTQSKGSEGFFDHNGNKEHGWSSWINRDNALKVSPDYSFRPYQESSADDYGPASKSGYFGSVNQSGFDSAIADNVSVFGVARASDSSGYWGFKVKGSGAAKEGAFGVTVENARIHVANSTEPVLVDVRITCMHYIVDGDIWSAFTPFIGIQKGTVMPNFVLLGVKEAVFKYEYFRSDTGLPYSLTSNITYTDIDDHQYVGVSEGDVNGIYLDKGTKLNYGYAGGAHMVFADYNEITGNAHLTAFGVSFKTGNNGMTLTFGNNESSVAGDATDAQKKNAFDYAWFGGGAYVMWTPPIPPPFKTVSDSDEDETTHNNLLDVNEPFTYRVYQQLPNGMLKEDYFSSFVMTDQIDTCLEIMSVRVYDERHGRVTLRGAWDSSGGVTNSEWFDISVDAGNSVTAAAKATVLASEDFYGGGNRLDSMKYLQIRVRWNPAVSPEVRAAHGHGISAGPLTPGARDGWNVKNRGTVVIGGAPENTGVVDTDVFIPHKEVSDADETLVAGDTVSNANEAFRYTVSQYVPANAGGGSYTGLVFTDEVEGCLAVEDVKVYRDGLTADVSDYFDIVKTNSVSVSARGSALALASFYGHEYTVVITARVRTDVTEATLREHGHYVDADRFLRYDNRAEIRINGRPGVSTSVVTTRVPVPDLKIEKTVEPYENQVGDVFRYTVKVSHAPGSAGDAVNVRVWDIDLPEAVTVSGLSVSGLPAGAASIAATPGGFCLTADVLKLTETAVIEFDAAADRSLNGTIITNSAWTTSFSDTGGDVTRPKSAGAEAYINSPKLNVVKTAQIDGDEIKKGDEIHYQAVVTNINPGTFMRDCIFYDEITVAGVRLVPGSITVRDSSNRLITNGCDITVSGNAFTIEPVNPINIAYGDMIVPPKELGRRPGFQSVIADYAGLPLENRITVTYSVNISDPKLIEGEIENTFVSPSRPGTNGDVIRDDPDVPSGGDFATHSAVVGRDAEPPDSVPLGPVTPPAIEPPPVAPVPPPPDAVITPHIVTVAAVDEDEPEDEDEEEEEEDTYRPGYRGRGTPHTGDDFNPVLVAVIMAFAGGLTLIMLIRRRV